MGDREHLTARTLGAIGDIAPEAWDACAGTDNPFVRHGFLGACEESGSATAQSGWAARHLVIENAAGELLAAAPLYLKGHSQGEYVFDHGWAAAYERAGGRYYPKLQCAVPFTPVTGPRLLARGDASRQMLAAALADQAARDGVSSLHVTFPTEADWQTLGKAGFLLRTDQQFHWLNKGYQSFDDFLADLSSRKRKAIRRERREALQNGITLEILDGGAITEAHWDAFFAFYQDTGARKWGQPYLTRAFFSLIGERLAGHIVLILCRRAGRYIAGALNLLGGDTLYGRYWGAIEHHRFLHFEVCYYRAIDIAIARGLARVEAGAQGEHKLARGYLPHLTYSAHWIADEGFREAVARFLAHERQHVAHEAAVLADYAPFKKGP
jgi:predicted N-acyltransferase